MRNSEGYTIFIKRIGNFEKVAAATVTPLVEKVTSWWQTNSCIIIICIKGNISSLPHPSHAKEGAYASQPALIRISKSHFKGIEKSIAFKVLRYAIIKSFCMKGVN